MTVQPIDLPAALQSYGHVVGRLIAAVADTDADTDAYPEGKPLAAKFVFTPKTELLRVEDTDGGVWVKAEKIEAATDTEGYLADSAGRRGVWLLAGIVWTVTVAAAGLKIAPFEIAPTDAHTATDPLDLVMGAAPPPEGPTMAMQTVKVPAGADTGQVLVWAGNGLGWADPAEGGTGGGGGGTPSTADFAAIYQEART